MTSRDETLYDHAGGQPALCRFIETFYAAVLADPVLQPLFGTGRATHVDRLVAFDGESFGGPDTFTQDLGGFTTLIDAHRGLQITDEQRERFVELYLEAAAAADLPDDEPFRAALRSHVEFGTRVAQQNSWARTDTELHPLREVPRWTWAGGS